jgi:hypothetical protein
MTELAIRDDRALALHQPAGPTTTTYARLAEWAQAAQAAHEVATSLVQTSFVPEAFRGKAHEATAAILAGAEIGLDPMASLRSFDVIQGTAAPRANTLRAVVQAAGHEIRVVESTATRAVVEGRRRGSADWQRSVWTIERAKQLGLTGKKNWQAQPGAMLVARATSEIARWIASDAILGIPYSAEELDDDGELSAVEPVTEVRPARRTAQRRTATPPAASTPAPEPELDEPADLVPEGLEPITGPQQKKLHALLNERGLGDRENGLRALSEILDREITTSKELSKQEAMRVIDVLEQQAAETVEPDFDDEWPATAQPGGGE